ncbi:MAG: phosphoribosyl-ATP diphosphatase [Congregibacter sp.]|nr:phosphoribosyl-ATP diphosphatase [Congregibacter sp.]MDP5070630.1 phosphoribosyl-ATP diphosphatase [Congregibacter sp.]
MQNDVLSALDSVLQERRSAAGDASYVASLYEQGLNKILEKIGEEATEVIIAAKDCKGTEGQQALLGEVADLWFHSMVLLTQQNLSSKDVLSILEARFGLSGHVEKAARIES